MELADVDRAVGRAGRYYLDDGLWEIAVGLWLGLTVAVPALVGGAVANWAPCVMLLGSLSIRPAVLAGKARWVFPRTGHVTYPEPGQAVSSPSLGVALMTSAGPARRRFDPLFAAGLAAAMAIPIALTRGLPGGDGAFHVATGAVLGLGFLLGAWRWRQRRWVAVGVALPAVGLLIANSNLDGSTKLAVHAAAMSTALLIAGGVALAGYLRRAPKAGRDDAR